MFETGIVLVILFLCMMNLLQFYIHTVQEKKLIECIMAKSYGDLVQGEVLLKQEPKKERIQDIEDLGPDPVTQLNKMFS